MGNVKSAESVVVQGRRLLPAPREVVRGQQCRRHRRLRRARLEARLSRIARGQLPLDTAHVSLAVQGRRLRHLALHGHPPELRDAAGVPDLSRPGARTRAAGDHRAGREPHVGSAPVVPRSPQLPGESAPRLLRVERDRRSLSGCPHHLPRHRALELGLGPGLQVVLLAPVLQPPAGLELRQPGRPR